MIGSVLLLAAAAGASNAVFTAPAQLVEVAPKRRINLVCQGDGPITVLFDAGGSDWSSIWSTIQPRVAARARACSYDRAGLGYSDPARGPRSPAAIADDIAALIKAVRWPGKVVLVGHSLGGFNTKLTAALHPKMIAGLVLLDPAEERTWPRTRSQMTAQFGAAIAARSELQDADFIRSLADHYADCARKAAAAPLEPESEDYRRCTDRPRPALGEAINAARIPLQSRATYQQAQASEIANCVYLRSDQDAAYAALFRPGIFGDMPLVVLTHRDEGLTDPIDLLSEAQGLMLHRQTAALSRRGRHESVTKSGHYLQLDQPDRVVAAIGEVIDALGAPQR